MFNLEIGEVVTMILVSMWQCRCVDIGINRFNIIMVSCQSWCVGIKIDMLFWSGFCLLPMFNFGCWEARVSTSECGRRSVIFYLFLRCAEFWISMCLHRDKQVKRVVFIFVHSVPTPDYRCQKCQDQQDYVGRPNLTIGFVFNSILVVI